MYVWFIIFLLPLIGSLEITPHLFSTLPSFRSGFISAMFGVQVKGLAISNIIDLATTTPSSHLCTTDQLIITVAIPCHQHLATIFVRAPPLSLRLCSPMPMVVDGDASRVMVVGSYYFHLATIFFYKFITRSRCIEIHLGQKCILSLNLNI